MCLKALVLLSLMILAIGESAIYRTSTARLKVRSRKHYVCTITTLSPSSSRTTYSSEAYSSTLLYGRLEIDLGLVLRKSPTLARLKIFNPTLKATLIRNSPIS